jgi:prophage maintenance system killer protein
VVFLAVNGIEFEPAEVDATIAVLRLPSGVLTDEAFIAWMRSRAWLRSA